MRLFSLLTLLTVLALPSAAQGPVPAAARQLLVVVTPDWQATSGTLRRFARTSDDAAWAEVGAAIPVVVGRGGLGWGRGLHPAQRGGPQKREGDGRAPAGVFGLPAAFGYAPPGDVGGLAMPYVRSDASVECVDDAASAYYNEIVDRDTTGRADWTSHEEMRRGDELYRLGVVVAHNAGPAVPQGGSCIFLHVWRGEGTTTSGCSAMAPAAMDALVGWLDAAAAPVLVQLPAAEYRRLRRAWGLPPASL